MLWTCGSAMMQSMQEWVNEWCTELYSCLSVHSPLWRSGIRSRCHSSGHHRHTGQ